MVACESIQESEEGVADEDNAGRLLFDCSSQIGVGAMVSQVHKPHPAEGKDDATECSGDKEKGQKVAIVPLQEDTQYQSYMLS